MIKLIFNSIFLLSILISSCNGQNKNAEGQSATAKIIGSTVQQIDKSIWVIFQDKKNNYWFGSNGTGVYCWDGKIIKQYTDKDGLIENRIRGIQEDGSGNIFFDTPIGVSKFDGEKFVSLSPVKSMMSQWKLQEDELWFKGNGDVLGAYRYDGETLHHLEFSDIDSLEHDITHGVYTIYKDKQSNIWFGTLSKGVCRFDGESLKWIYEKELSVLDDGRVPAVRSILEDNEGFFRFSNIISKYKISTSKTKTDLVYEKLPAIDLSKQKSKMVLPYYTSAVIDKENLWMTNYNEGVWNYNGEDLTNYIVMDGEVKVLPVSIYKDNSGGIWVATDNAGVYKYNGSEFVKFGK